MSISIFLFRSFSTFFNVYVCGFFRFHLLWSPLLHFISHNLFNSKMLSYYLYVWVVPIMSCINMFASFYLFVSFLYAAFLFSISLFALFLRFRLYLFLWICLWSVFLFFNVSFKGFVASSFFVCVSFTFSNLLHWTLRYWFFCLLATWCREL
jgi:hypothetical protein